MWESTKPLAMYFFQDINNWRGDLLAPEDNQAVDNFEGFFHQLARKTWGSFHDFNYSV